MKSKLFILALAATTLLTSCEKIIDFNADVADPQVVMISRPEADSAVMVNMSYSRFFLDGHNFKKINDALLLLTVNGAGYTSSLVDSGMYRFNVTPRVGDTMTLSATVPGYNKVVKASTRIPGFANYSVAEYVMDTTSRSCNYYKIRVRINKSSGTHYYRLSVWHPSVSVEYTYSDDYTHITGREIKIDTTKYQRMPMESTDPIINQSKDVEDIFDDMEHPDMSNMRYGDYFCFSDEMFDGNSHELTVSCEYWHSTNTNLGYTPIKVVVESLSPELYRYVQSAIPQYGAGSLFSEPVQVICNVDGGIGVFGASNASEKIARNPVYEDFYKDYYYEMNKRRYHAKRQK